jgi:Flp pilus assembly pilin Flp
LIIQLYVRVLSSLRFREEEGQTLVEYALILVLVSTAAFTLLSAIGGFPFKAFSSINADF